MASLLYGLVCLQVTWCWEAPVTLCALEWNLSWVDPLMGFQVTWCWEALVTLCALEWPVWILSCFFKCDKCDNNFALAVFKKHKSLPDSQISSTLPEVGWSQESNSHISLTLPELSFLVEASLAPVISQSKEWFQSEWTCQLKIVTFLGLWLKFK